MKLARIQDGVVVEVNEKPDLVDELVSPPTAEEINEEGAVIRFASPGEYKKRRATLDDFYHPDAGFIVIDDDNVKEGMLYDGKKFKAAPEFVPQPRPRIDPVEKLRLFLAANPDVLDLMK